MKMKWTSRAHPISDIRDWKRNNRLELRPDYQRKSVWSKSAQIALIDTILHNIPFPKIYIQAIVKNENTYRIVIDGQQRMTAILDFIENRLRLKRANLSEEFTSYDGKTFQELPENVRNDILQYNVDFNEISNTTEEDVRDMYIRVNKYTIQLNKQELRRADWPGDLMKVAEELSNFPYFDDAKLFSTGQKRRLLDVEYILELLCVILEGEQDKKDALDDFCERYTILSGTFRNEDVTAFIEKVKRFFISKPELLEDAEELKKSTTRFSQMSDGSIEDAEELKGFNTRFSEMSDGRKMLVFVFCNVLSDMMDIFDDSFPIAKTRFRQKADFYSLFSAIHALKKDGRTLDGTKLVELRMHMKALNDGIMPHSENKDYSEYAIRCITDNNSLGTRRWRREFLNRYLEPAYLLKEAGDRNGFSTQKA